MSSERRFRIHDTMLCISTENSTESENTFKSLCQYLRRTCRFKIGKDPRIERDYKSLSKTHRYGNHGDLECKLEYYPAGMKIEFYQSLNFENRYGGEYDFGRLGKMPYLIRLRYEWVIRKLVKWLESHGYQQRLSVDSPNPDPLAWFNGRWDGEYERKRGIHRFHRGEDGWPDDRELRNWDRRDADRQLISSGQVKFCVVHGRAMRCKVYGGINGMWACVYGPGRDDTACKNAKEIHSEFPGRGRIFSVGQRLKNLHSQLKRSVESQDFLRAHAIKSHLDRTALKDGD